MQIKIVSRYVYIFMQQQMVKRIIRYSWTLSNHSKGRHICMVNSDVGFPLSLFVNFTYILTRRYITPTHHDFRAKGSHDIGHSRMSDSISIVAGRTL